jgi:hypothetical protein
MIPKTKAIERQEKAELVASLLAGSRALAEVQPNNDALHPPSLAHFFV